MTRLLSRRGAVAARPSGITLEKDIGVAFTTGTQLTSRVITVPAGGVPVDNHVLIAGVSSANRTLTVTDSKSNSWVTRVDALDSGGVSVNTFLADAKITNALLVADTITCTVNTAAHIAFTAVEFSGLHLTTWYDGATTGTYADANATGGAKTPTVDGALVLGVFGHTDLHQISTPGTNFTDMTGTANSPASRGIDWQYLIQASAASITATATLSGAPALGAGVTAAYRPA